jgi:hypothetical protein
VGRRPSATRRVLAGLVIARPRPWDRSRDAMYTAHSLDACCRASCSGPGRLVMGAPHVSTSHSLPFDLVPLLLLTMPFMGLVHRFTAAPQAPLLHGDANARPGACAARLPAVPGPRHRWFAVNLASTEHWLLGPRTEHEGAVHARRHDDKVRNARHGVREGGLVRPCVTHLQGKTRQELSFCALGLCPRQKHDRRSSARHAARANAPLAEYVCAVVIRQRCLCVPTCPGRHV